jgi:hypothetical protein
MSMVFMGSQRALWLPWSDLIIYTAWRLAVAREYSFKLIISEIDS